MPNRQIHLEDLTITPINVASPIPLYYQVEADLRNILASGQVSAGDLLPTEHDLANAYNVGRHTIRTALSRLVQDNLILRRAGHGTVVRGSEDRRQFSLARSFTRQMEAMGLVPESRVLQCDSRTVQSTDPKPLQPMLGAPVLFLNRLRLGSGEPIGIQQSYILLERCPALPMTDLTRQSLYAVLANQFDLHITRITHAVSAATADRKQADLLHIEARAPLLVVNTTAYLEGETLIEFSHSWYRADKYEYTTTMTSS